MRQALIFRKHGFDINIDLDRSMRQCTLGTGCAMSALRERAAAATASISSRLPLQWSAMSQPADKQVSTRHDSVPLKAPIDKSSEIRRPCSPIFMRINSMTLRDMRRRRIRVDSGKDDMRRHRDQDIR